MKTRPFDVSLARTFYNSNGLEVTNGYGDEVRILTTAIDDDFCIEARVISKDGEFDEVMSFNLFGERNPQFPKDKFNLLLIE